MTGLGLTAPLLHARFADTWTRSERALLPAIALMLCASRVLSPDQVADGPVICPFRLVTGLPCPGCGLTRSFVAFAHGDTSAAFRFNLFGPILFTSALVYLMVSVPILLSGRRPIRLSVRNPLLAAPLMIWMAWAAVRMLAAV